MSGDNTTTQNTNSEPWGPTQNLLKTGLNDAYGLYKGGYNVYTGPTVIPFSNQTTQMMDGLQGLANRNINGKGLQSNMQDIINNGGFNKYQSNALRDMQGNANTSQRQFSNLLNSGGLNPAQRDAMNDMKWTTDQSMNRYNTLLERGGFNPAQRQAMESLKGQNSLAGQRLNEVMSTGGFTPAQRDAMKAMRGAVNQNSPLFQNLINQGGLNADQQTAMGNYRNTATSSFDPNADPNFQKVLSGALDQASNSVNMGAAAAGRSGSGVHQNVMGKTTGDLSANMLSQEYNNGQNRKDAANANLFAGGQQGMSNQQGLNSAIQSGAGNLAQLGQMGFQNMQSALNQAQSASGNLLAGGQQGINNLSSAMGDMQNAQNTQFNAGQQGRNNINQAFNNMQGAQGQLFNAGQQGLSNMQSAYQAAQLPYQTLGNIGSMNEDLATRQKNDELRLFDAQNNAPWEHIMRLINVGNLGGNYKSTQTTTEAPGQNPFLTALGYGTGGIGLLNAFGGGVPTGAVA